jgi:hypothetical protein
MPNEPTGFEQKDAKSAKTGGSRSKVIRMDRLLERSAEDSRPYLLECQRAEYGILLYSFGCGEVEVRLTGLLLSRSAGREYKVGL